MAKINICCRLEKYSKQNVESIGKKHDRSISYVGGRILENLTKKEMERIFNRDRTIEG